MPIDTFTLAVLVLAFMLLLILIGTPLLVVFGTGSILLYSLAPAGRMVILGQQSVDGIFSFTLIAIPMFILTGDLIVETGVATKLFDLAEESLGWMRGGLGAAAQVACGVFGAISGSNVAGAAAIGRVASTELIQRGYPRSYTGGFVAGAAVTGILIPPSVSFIVLALVMRFSISDLFIGTIFPGFTVLGSMMVVTYFISRRRGIDQGRQPFDAMVVARKLWQAKYGLVIPLIILGGIYGGVFTATESATAAIMFMLLIGVVNRDISFRNYRAVLRRSAALNGMISPLVAIFTIFSQAIGFYQIPSMIANTMLNFTGGSVWMTVTIITIILIAAGTVISTIPNILLLGPILIPIGVQIGFDPIHFSIYFLCVLALGYITPPVGLNLFVLAGILDESVEDVSREAVPFFVAGLIASIIILLFPSLTFALL